MHKDEDDQARVRQAKLRQAGVKRAGVVGWPVAHSRSPLLHGYWLDKYDIAGSYEPIPISIENFDTEFRALADRGFVGCNVTVPHKERALAACDVVDANARRIGAVNTVVIDADGRFSGSNSDGFGFMENLRRSAPGWRAADGPALLIGAGGAARAILAALCDAGVPEIRIVNRTRHNAEKLAADIGGPVQIYDWARREQACADVNLLVNSSVLGMEGKAALDLALDFLPVAALVNDIVYTPLKTALLRAAAARGNPTVDGLGMLLHQARPGFAAWFGVEPAVDEKLRARLLADIGTAAP